MGKKVIFILILAVIISVNSFITAASNQEISNLIQVVMRDDFSRASDAMDELITHSEDTARFIIQSGEGLDPQYKDRFIYILSRISHENRALMYNYLLEVRSGFITELIINALYISGVDIPDDVLSRLMQSSNEDIVVPAMLLVEKNNHEALLPQITELINSDNSAVRLNAVIITGNFRYEPAIPSLSSTLGFRSLPDTETLLAFLDDENQLNKETAKSILKIKGMEYEQLLIALLINGTHNQKLACASILGYVKTERGVLALIDGLSGNMEIAQQCTVSLMNMGRFAWIKLVVKLPDVNRQAKMLILTILSNDTSPVSRDIIARYTSNSDMVIAEHAAILLERIESHMQTETATLSDEPAITSQTNQFINNGRVDTNSSNESAIHEYDNIRQQILLRFTTFNYMQYIHHNYSRSITNELNPERNIRR